jgi:hypothetical protein
MRKARILLAIASVLAIAGSGIHARAFPGADVALAGTTLRPFYVASFKALWLADSATLLILGAALGFVAARPRAGTRPLLISLALIPAATAVLIYYFGGPFRAAHLLMVIAGLTVAAAALLRPVEAAENPGGVAPGSAHKLAPPAA